MLRFGRDDIDCEVAKGASFVLFVFFVVNLFGQRG
jgi:hypothetical protein